MESDFFDFLNERGYSYSCKEPLKKHTSFRIGGEAALLVRPASIPELCLLIRKLKAAGIPYYILGRGTNLLCSDAGYSGCVISTEHLGNVCWQNNLLRAECGAPMRRLCATAEAMGCVGWSGIAGIPGSVGGAIRINAGAFGNSVSEYLVRVGIFDAAKERIRFLSKEALFFGYRKSALLLERHLTILWGYFRFPRGDTALEREKQAENAKKRQTTQPVCRPSAGSVFRNPIGDHAGRLIEDVGLRGVEIGGAKVSHKHANIIVNEKNATFADVTALIELIRTRVYQKHGVFLTPETEILK